MPSRTDDPISKVRELQRRAAERYSSIDSYIVRLRRREQINGKDKPEEIMLFKFRKQPWSVYFKWLGEEGKGREVIYVRGQHGDKLHTRLAAGDMALIPAGRRLALDPNNVLVRSRSRHAITEAGIGVIIARMGENLALLQKGDPRAGTVKALGQVNRPEFETPVEGVEHSIPSGAEPTLPRGGRRLCFFDPASGLPVLLITLDEGGHEVEYYCYDRFQYPVHLDDDDFHPDRLWGMNR